MRGEKIEGHLVQVRLSADDVALPAPLQHRPLAEMRKVDVVQGIDGEAREVGARAEDLMRREGQPRIVRIADPEAGAVLLAVNAGADLAPVAELLAEVEPVIEGVHAVLRALLLPDEERQ